LKELDPDDARALREAEAREAARVLGVETIDFLRLPDLGLVRRIAEGSVRLADLL
jgi:LmbE family N-acetylglucosaminyl deacetylase